PFSEETWCSTSAIEGRPSESSPGSSRWESSAERGSGSWQSSTALSPEGADSRTSVSSKARPGLKAIDGDDGSAITHRSRKNRSRRRRPRPAWLVELVRRAGRRPAGDVASDGSEASGHRASGSGPVRRPTFLTSASPWVDRKLVARHQRITREAHDGRGR